MKSTILILTLFLCLQGMAQSKTDTSRPLYHEYDTVVITALGRQSIRNIPYSIQRVHLPELSKTPRTQFMQQLSLLPSVSGISSGSGINKPVIRGLSFNHIQVFAMGTRIDNQTWDDRHDIGISDNGFDEADIISGPAALLYGPNAMGGAIVLHETAPAVNEKTNGYVQLGFFGNSLGGHLSAGIRAGKKEFYYSLHTSLQMHANYVQGGEEDKTDSTGGEEDKPLAANSKFTSFAFKGMIGIRKANRQHQLNYNLYGQQLGIIEDESMDAANNAGSGGKEEERDYEMEAPYQAVLTHVISTENRFAIGHSDLVVNAGYQFNDRKEYEPGDQPKSKELGVGLDLQTVTGDIQWQTNRGRPAGITLGLQGFYQNNRNKGNQILVPDAHLATLGAYLLGRWSLPQWNFLAGLRVDQHQLNMFNTESPEPDTLHTPFARPAQQLTRQYTPASFSAGIVYHVSEAFSIKVNGANGYSAPNYAQLTAFGRHEGTYRFEIGDNDLKMERNIEADLTLQWTDRNMDISLNGYSNHINHYIYINPSADTVGDLQVYRWSQHNAAIRGLELNLRVHPENLSWLEGFVHAGLISGRLTNGEGYLPYIPADKVIAGITLKKQQAKKWQSLYATVQLDAYGSQKDVAAFESFTAGYALTDIFLGIVPPIGKQQQWSVAAFCTNLFNIGYFNHLSLIKSIGIREPGRNIGVQVRFGFS